MRTVTLLGATGSIGLNTLDVIGRHPERFRVAALCAQNQHQRMVELCRRFAPGIAVMSNPEAATRLREGLSGSGVRTRVLGGTEALCEAATLSEVDTVVAGIVGAAGLAPTLAAARAGKRILLANKEALVMGGALFLQQVAAGGAQLIPIDSEHNAIFQCVPVEYSGNLSDAGIRRILLTGSGGPLRTFPLEQLHTVTPDQACAHPNWVMGRKISVDSATMMNKGLEVIEARWLFGLPAEQIDVVVHPQSVVHSMVEYLDGAIVAQLGNPDMRTPIAHALAFPERIEAGVDALDLFRSRALTFEPPDFERFPCLRLAYAALRDSPSAAVALNAANEVAVAQFLDGRLRFDHIAPVIEESVGRDRNEPVDSLDAIIEIDLAMRAHAFEHCRELGRRVS